MKYDTPAQNETPTRETIQREIARMREIANRWRDPSLQQVEGPDGPKIYGGTIADDIDRWTDLLEASVPEKPQVLPEGYERISKVARGNIDTDTLLTSTNRLNAVIDIAAAALKRDAGPAGDRQ